MTDTSQERWSEVSPNKSALYRRNSQGEIEPDQKTDLSVKVPGGGLVSTARDLVRFGSAFIDGRLVEAETIERMLVEPQVKWRRRVPYGYGWMFWTDDELGRILHQDGGQSGTSTELRIYRDHDVVVAVIGNVARTGGEIGQIRAVLVDLALARAE